MTCSVCFLLFLGAFARSSAEDSSGTIRVVDDDNNFLADNPGVNLTRMDSLRGLNAISYRYGTRNWRDHILDVLYDYTGWVSPHNSEALVKYSFNPNVGAVISFVNILVEQSSNKGKAYIVKGGIGQKYISILIHANNTYYFSYVAEIYGS